MSGPSGCASLASGMASPEVEPKLCRLEEAKGRRVVCSGESCAFWEPGGAVLDGRCVLEGIDFTREPGLADWLLEVRDTIAHMPHR